ncbi:MAG: hypothetical protein HFJ54_02530 [Clostridia bacterium]|nr:hypothetical protein [Clostridia bacterium]
MGKKKKKSKKKSKKKNLIFIIILLLIIGAFSLKLYMDNSYKINDNRSSKIAKDDEDEITEESSFPDEVFKVPVHTELIDSGTETRPGIKRKIKYLVIHETDNFEKGTGAKNHAKFLKNSKDSTSWHYTVDDKEIYHHIPDNEIAHHAATDIGNRYGVGIELCVNKDGKFNKTFENATKLVAYLLKEYKLDTSDIKTHHDFSGKDCPHTILKDNRMNEFIRKVKKLL